MILKKLISLKSPFNCKNIVTNVTTYGVLTNKNKQPSAHEYSTKI